MPSTPHPRALYERYWRQALRRRPAPGWSALTPISAAPAWIFYFVFAPDGRLSSSQRYTLDRLRQEGARLAVICASGGPRQVPPELERVADALYWKALPGFDFSAYAIAVAETARRSPGADIVLLNDSVLGPFASLTGLFASLPWRFSGLTASSMQENHIQSYALQIRKVDEAALAALRQLLQTGYSYDDFNSVVYCQEVRLARLAAGAMSAGARWFGDQRLRRGDLPLACPLALLDAGFPFIKRSLFGKFAQRHPLAPLQERLRQFGHAVPGAR